MGSTISTTNNSTTINPRILETFYLQIQQRNFISNRITPIRPTIEHIERILDRSLLPAGAKIPDRDVYIEAASIVEKQTLLKVTISARHGTKRTFLIQVLLSFFTQFDEETERYATIVELVQPSPLPPHP